MSKDIALTERVRSTYVPQPTFDNAARAALAERSLEEYRTTGAPDEPLDTCACDMITNLLHLLRLCGYTDEELDNAYLGCRINFDEEEAEEAEEAAEEGDDV